MKNSFNYRFTILFAFLVVLSSMLTFAQEKNNANTQKSGNDKNLVAPDNQMANNQRAATMAPDKAATDVYPAEDEKLDLQTPASYNLAEIQKRLVYPEEGYRARVEGQVILRVLVDKEGYPVRALVQKSDNKIFETNSINAVMNTRYTPAVDKNGNSVSSWISVPIYFKTN